MLSYCLLWSFLVGISINIEELVCGFGLSSADCGRGFGGKIAIEIFVLVGSW